MEYFRKNGGVTRFLLIAGFVLLVALIFPRYGYRGHDYVQGKPWQEEDLVAPFDFSVIKSPGVQDDERRQAIEGANEVFLLNHTIVEQNRLALQHYFVQLAEIDRELDGTKPGDSTGLAVELRLRTLRPIIESAAFGQIREQYTNLGVLRERALQLYNRIYTLAYIDKEPGAIASRMVSLRSQANMETVLDKNALMYPSRMEPMIRQACADLSPEAIRLVLNALKKYALPNYLYDQYLSKEEEAYALQYISPITGKISKGQVIIRHGDIVTPQHDREIRSLYAVKYSKMELRSYLSTLLGQIMLLSLLVAITVVFLKINRKEIHRRTRRLSLIFFIFFLIIIILVAVNGLSAYISEQYNINLLYVVPLSLGAIMLTVFFDDRVGFVGNIMVATMAAIANHNNFEIFYIQFIAGSAAVFNLRYLRKRQQFFLTTGILLLAYAMSYLSYQLYLKGDFTVINYQNLVLFVINAFFTLATYPIIYIFERIFGIVSDLAYMELLDTDHPVLKDLAIKAPGTYQHSLQVAHLAEEAAKKIGANALQVHAGALFHDIGKIYQAEYFTENKAEGASPHQTLEPRQSAQIIISHVVLGETLAREHRLPEEIIDFIKTHHGYSRTEFFYQKHLKDHPEDKDNKVREREFRYPGPLPTTKEQAIVMIADSCEAAARSLDNPTKEALEELIERIVTGKINDNQLILAKITFRDLTIIKREILRILTSVYHHRVKYPDQDKSVPSL